MNFGVVLPYGHDCDVLELACRVEKAGWDAVFVGDAIWTVDPLILLAGIAMRTSRIRLGTMVLVAPLRSPRQLAGESLALDRLSNGRLILGLGMGATWMGWQGFPDEDSDTLVRAEKLDETIDLLTQFYQRKPFDFEGRHYRVALTRLDERHYPPAPVQQPRIPLWIPAVCNRRKSLRRVLKCDGVFLQKMDSNKKFVEVSPGDVAEVRAFVNANRPLTTLFDIVQEGQTGGLSKQQQADRLVPWAQAGVTWWAEGLWNLSPEQQYARIDQGPPNVPP